MGRDITYGPSVPYFDPSFWDEVFKSLAQSGMLTREMCYQCQSEPLHTHELLCAKCFTDRQGSS